MYKECSKFDKKNDLLIEFLKSFFKLFHQNENMDGILMLGTIMLGALI